MSCENGQEIRFGQVFIPRRDKSQSLHVVTDPQCGIFVAAARLIRTKVGYAREVPTIGVPGLFEVCDIGTNLAEMSLEELIGAYIPSYTGKPSRSEAAKAFTEGFYKSPRCRI